MENSTLKDNEDFQVEVAEASLEDEMQTLGQECSDLGDEHRMLECNVGSVSGVMFTECQECAKILILDY